MEECCGGGGGSDGNGNNAAAISLDCNLSYCQNQPTCDCTCYESTSFASNEGNNFNPRPLNGIP